MFKPFKWLVSRFNTPKHVMEFDRQIRKDTEFATALANMAPHDPNRFGAAGEVMFIEKSLEQARKRASDLIADQGFTVPGARAQATKDIGALVRHVTTHRIATEFRKRMATMPLVELLDERAQYKLYSDTEVARQEYCTPPNKPAG